MSAIVQSTSTWASAYSAGIPVSSFGATVAEAKEANPFQQAEADVKKFKAKILSPEVLDKKRPALIAELEAEIDKYMASKEFKGWMKAQAMRAVQRMVRRELSSHAVQSAISNQVNTMLFSTKGDFNANKQP